jgi:predicted regulator of Ras-like GTPase activity (Roadblock/LC7/MglB family)
MLPQDIEEKAISAMAAATVSIGKRVGTALHSGDPHLVIIDGTNMSVIIKDVGKMVLIGLAASNSEIGLIGFELDKAAKRIKDALEVTTSAG